MLVKILFTLGVIIVVALVFRTKKDAIQANRPRVVNPESEERSLSPRVVAYGLIGVLILISVSVFVIKYQSDNRIVNITVIAKDGESTLYQARHKDVKGRQFVTLDGIQVTLGESDRIEMEE